MEYMQFGMKLDLCKMARILIYVNGMKLDIWVNWHKISIHVKRHELNIRKFGINWAYVKLTCNLELGHMLIM